MLCVTRARPPFSSADVFRGRVSLEVSSQVVRPLLSLVARGDQKMRVLLAILFVVATAAMTSAENDKISWTENDAGQKDASREAEARYLVYEPSEHLENFDNNGIHAGLGPHNPGGPYGPYGRPYAPGYQGSNGVLVGPGGPTGIIGRPPRYDPNGPPGGFPGAVPPWIRDDPRHHELDTCKCRYSFNCPSPGLKFGHCAREKKYCCFNSRRFPQLLGGPHYPYYPGAPHRYPSGFGPNYYGNRRPYYGHQRPSFGDYHSGGYGPHGGYGHRNEFEPYGYDAEADDYEIYGRSLGKNRTTLLSERSSADEEIEKQK